MRKSMEWICLLFPACIAMNIRRRRVTKVKTADAFECIFRWAGWVIAINMLVMLVISYVLRIDGVIEEAFRSFGFFIKYIGIATVFALVLPYIVEVIEKYVEVSLKIDNEKK